jgi:hypothetical protein
MSVVNSDEISQAVGGGSASAGLGGATNPPRATEVKGAARKWKFAFTIPASGAGSVAGDQIRVARLKTTDIIYGVRIYAPVLGASTTLAIGKTDTNNSANNDANHYLVPSDTSVAGILEANGNMLEQVGADATGAETDTGDAITGGAPGGGYGSGPIDIMLTIGGTPTATARIMGYVEYAGDMS